MITTSSVAPLICPCCAYLPNGLTAALVVEPNYCYYCGALSMNSGILKKEGAGTLGTE